MAQVGKFIFMGQDVISHKVHQKLNIIKDGHGSQIMGQKIIVIMCFKHINVEQ